MTVEQIKMIMKKFFLCFMMLCTASVFYAQNDNKHPETILVKIGEFKARGDMFIAEADISPDTSIVYRYRIPATHTYPANFYYDYRPVVYIACTPTMKDELQRIAAKYKEWTETATKNNVGKMQKVIELEFPVFMLSLHKKSKGYPKYLEFKNSKFTFSVFDSQKSPSIFCNSTFKADALGLTVSTGLVFSTPKEFDDFIEFLDPEKVKKRIKEGKTTLFPQDETTGTQNTRQKVQSVQQDTPTTTPDMRSIDKEKVARGALDRRKRAAQKASKVK